MLEQAYHSTQRRGPRRIRFWAPLEETALADDRPDDEDERRWAAPEGDADGPADGGAAPPAGGGAGSPPGSDDDDDDDGAQTRMAPSQGGGERQAAPDAPSAPVMSDPTAAGVPPSSGVPAVTAGAAQVSRPGPAFGKARSVELSPDELRPSRVGPAVIIGVLVAIVAVIVVGVYFMFLAEEQKMSVEERMEIQKNIFILPIKDQLPQWRKWAASEENEDLRCEALSQLAFLRDDEGVKLAILALAEDSHKIRGTCAQVLAYYGPKAPGIAEARPALLKALEQADESDRRQIVWALVELGEPTVFETAMGLYRTGEITTVQRLDGGGAFNPMKVAALISLDELAKLSGDTSTAVRQLVATILSDNAEAKWTNVLIKLVQDPEIVVAREAASGLGRIGDEKARDPLLEALRKADKDSRLKFLQALRDGIGGEGLVLALETVVQEPESRNWFQHRQLFDMLGMLADPRAGDALVAWVERAKPHPHWRTVVGLRLAEIGDVRGAKYIATRMTVEGKDIYSREKFWQADRGGHLLRTDRHRVIGARMLADLAVVHPEQRDRLADVAADPVMTWLTSKPQPHANGLRFLAAVDYEDARKQMRDWAFPKDKLPVEGQQPPFPKPFETAQSGLRYIGWMRDGPSLPKLLDQFDRKKDKKMDITQRGLEGAGLAMLAMALRAVTVGASDGLAQWGPDAGESADKTLMEFIEDETWHEEARFAACNALAWIASDKTMQKVVEKVGEYAAKDDPKEQLIGGCYAEALSRRPIPDAVEMLIDLLRPELEIGVRNLVGYAIGTSGFDKAGPAAKQRLYELIKSPELRTPAALALILGGSPEDASRAIAMYADVEKTALEDLKDVYYRAFGYWSDKDLEVGNIYRWVENAEAMSRVKIGDTPQEWARQRLRAQFDNLQFDNGPHSETRVVLRYRLLQLARTGSPEQKRGAIETLKFMGEQGSLMALRHEKGETGELGRQAFFELMHPRLVKADEGLKKFKKDNK